MIAKDDQPFQIQSTSVTCGTERLNLPEAISTTPQLTHSISLQIPASFLKGEFLDSFIDIQTSHPEMPSLQVPVVFSERPDRATGTSTLNSGNEE